MARDVRTGSPLAAGIIGLLVTGAYLALWQVTVERPTCAQTGVFACAGPAILMYAVGLPVTYVVWSLALRLLRAPLAWLAPLAVLIALAVLVPMSEAVEPPAWVWPVVAGAFTAAWSGGLGRARSRGAEPARQP